MSGTISGNGVISAKFANQGSLIVDGGKLAIEKSFANGGQILLTSAIASLSGGAVDNTGRIERRRLKHLLKKLDWDALGTTRSKVLRYFHSEVAGSPGTWSTCDSSSPPRSSTSPSRTT